MGPNAILSDERHRRRGQHGSRVWRMHWFTMVRILHIAAGTLALMVLGVPIFARKGGKAHISFGRVYAYAMGAVAATGAPLALRSAFAEDAARQARGWFLFYVALLAFDTAWMGVRALRTKARQGPNRRVIDFVPPTALLVGAVYIFVLGVTGGVALYVIFALLGALIATNHNAFWLRAPRSRFESLLFHIGAMGTSSITAITAFLVVNARHVGLAPFGLIAWTLPAVVGTILTFLARRAWRAKLEPAQPASRAD
jgi:hypothetical protein